MTMTISEWIEKILAETRTSGVRITEPVVLLLGLDDRANVDESSKNRMILTVEVSGGE